MITLELGGVAVWPLAQHTMRQSYEDLRASTDHEMYSFAAFRQTHGNKKLRTTINAQGWEPHGLAGLDYTQPLVLKCVAPRSLTALVNAIALPAARRADVPPRGFALKADGTEVETPLSLAADIATLTTVAGAVAYRVAYFPQITVFATLEEEDTDMNAANFSFTLKAREV